jgi:hypothetical protein
MNNPGSQEMNNDAAVDQTNLILVLKNIGTWMLIGIGSVTAEKLAVYLGIVATLLTIFSIVRREFFSRPKKD